MSPSWLVITNPKKISAIASAQGYSTRIHVTLQQVHDLVSVFAPTPRITCQTAHRWPATELSFTPSQPPPPVLIHECNQAFTWVQKP
eukprot:3852902-Heterocapsa_arctica.AAC.1